MGTVKLQIKQVNKSHYSNNTLNDIDLDMTLTFEQASVEYKHRVKLCEYDILFI